MKDLLSAYVAMFPIFGLLSAAFWEGNVLTGTEAVAVTVLWPIVATVAIVRTVVVGAICLARRI